MRHGVSRDINIRDPNGSRVRRRPESLVRSDVMAPRDGGPAALAHPGTKE